MDRAGEFDDFPTDADRPSLQEVTDSFFTAWREAEQTEHAVKQTHRKAGRLVGAAMAVGVLVAVPVILSQQPAVSSQSQPSVILDRPVDEGGSAELSWHGTDGLRYAVVVAGTSVPTSVIFVSGSRTSVRVPIDPVRGYCFLIQATDGRQFYQTPPLAIRGAACRL
jgi:hypothetical protein